MGFDLKKFESAEYKDRQEPVDVPALSAFFGKKEKPVWVVRGLTHAEISRAAEKVSTDQNVEALVEALAGSAKQKADGIKSILGVSGDEVPQETKKRLEYLVMCSVDPEITLDVAVKLSVNYPIEFSQITNKILQLTGKGRVQAQVKRQPSGE